MVPARKTVLFLTNSERGQANVVLAVAYELLLRDEVDVHIASWTPLEARVAELNKRYQFSAATPTKPGTTAACRSPGRITFHTCPFLPLLATITANTCYTVADMPHKPGYDAGYSGTAHFRDFVPAILAPWNPPEYLEIVEWSGALATKLATALVVVDPLLGPAHDMVRKMHLSHLVLSPCSLAAGLMALKPWLAGSENQAESKLPDDISSTHNAMSGLLCSPRISALATARKSAGIGGQLASFEPYVPNIPHICPSLPSIDLPMSIPANAHFVGPILLPQTPLSLSDPDLLAWLRRSPTVLLNLGSLLELRPEQARAQAAGLRVLLLAHPNTQVLWKIQTAKAAEAAVRAEIMTVLGSEIQNGTVRTEAWLRSDPLAIMQSGHLVAVVHHGGANSWFEATCAGIPQIILPQWYDTYDYAGRAEYLRIGIYGNKTSAPAIDADEFGAALVKVVGDQAMHVRAAELGALCKASRGRESAADLITAYA